MLSLRILSQSCDRVLLGSDCNTSQRRQSGGKPRWVPSSSSGSNTLTAT